MTIDIVSDDREFMLLQPEWDALWSSVENPYYFQSFSYVAACWQQMYKPEGTLLRCIVGRQSGKVVLLWPLILTKRGFLRLLKPLTAGASEYNVPLVSDGPDAAEICSLAWSSARSRIKADIISMPLVREGSCLHAVLSREGAISVHGETCYTQQGGETWKDWDTYFKAVSAGHSFKSERKKRKLLGEQGIVEFQTLEHSAEGAATIDWCLKHKRDWAERVDKRSGWLYAESFRNVLVSLFTGESTGERYISFLMTLDGAPIAVKIAAYNAVRLEGIICSFDPAWSKYSPGALLDEFIARWTVERSLEHDFGVGTERYKKIWSCDFAIAVGNYQFPGSLLGHIVLKLRHWQRLRAERLRASNSEPDKGAVSADAEPA